MANIAVNAPDILLGSESAPGIQEYLATRGITRNDQALKNVSEKLAKAASKHVVKMVRDHPDWVESGRAGKELYNHLLNNNAVQDTVRMLVDARKAEGHVLDLGDDFKDLGTINYAHDYRALTLNLP